MSLKTRNAFYGLALASAVIETVFGFLSSFTSLLSPLTWVVGKVAGAFSVVTWIWISILLSYNNRPSSEMLLTRSSVHLMSVGLMALIWLVLAVILTTQAARECSFDTAYDGAIYFTCAWVALASSFAYLVSLSCALATTAIYVSGRRTAAGLNSNIALLGSSEAIFK